MYRFYNVICFAANPLSQINNVITRIYNSLVKALNDFNRMPCFILIIPNNDVIKHVLTYEAGTSMPSGAAIDWMSNQIIRAILAKKEFMTSEKTRFTVANGT